MTGSPSRKSASTRRAGATDRPRSAFAQRKQARPPAEIRACDELDSVFASVARYFALLAEPTRLKILHTICHSEQSVSAIVEATGATQTNVSRHLSLLHQAGVVSRRKDGNAVHYQVSDLELIAICRTMCVQIAGRIDAGQPLRNELLEFARRS